MIDSNLDRSKIDFYTNTYDSVIQGNVISASTNYDIAINNFAPLIRRLDIQRDTLKTKFYSRLEKDIVKGCVMPPITIAMINNKNDFKDENDDFIYNYIIENIKESFVLDGIQRLNTLIRASRSDNFDLNNKIFVNFIIAPSRDKLLYRMITLNNGQRPMSARHQIEVLADTFFDFEEISINLIAEKGKGRVRAPYSFKKEDFIKGYIAYLSDSVGIDNQKIIEEKMDELIANRIIESEIPNSNNEFSNVIELINKFSADDYLKSWIRIQNNFIGFSVGIKKSYHDIQNDDCKEISESIKKFEKAFSAIDVSKVNIGKMRRELVYKFIGDYKYTKDLDDYSLLDKISNWI